MPFVVKVVCLVCDHINGVEPEEVTVVTRAGVAYVRFVCPDCGELTEKDVDPKAVESLQSVPGVRWEDDAEPLVLSGNDELDLMALYGDDERWRTWFGWEVE